MTTVGVPRLGAGTLAGNFARAKPTCAVTAPSGTLSAYPFNVTWTYTSTVSRAQDSYRIRLLSTDGATVIYDTGILSGAGTTAALSVILSAGSSYLVAVSVFDGFDWSVEATSTVLYDGDSIEDIPDLATVGTVYEVAINGVGYMLADHPDKETRYERRVIPLDTQRLATGDTPFSEAVDRYAFLGFTDWAGGGGQRFYKRADSTDNSFYTSHGINPFTPGELRLLPSTTLHCSDSYAFSKAVVASGKLFVTTASGELSAYDDPTDSTATTFSITGAGTPLDLASDGTFWYFADGSNIYRNNAAADPAATWSTVDARVIEWCSDRMVVAYKTGSSTVPNALATIGYASGAVTGPASGSNPFTFEEETDIRSITSGDGWVWWAAARYDKSYVYGWQLGSTDSYVTALELPAGQDVRSVGYYQGNVFVRARELTTTSVSKAIIYRCATSQGMLTPDKVLELSSSTVDHADGDFAGDDRFVYFSWRGMNNYSGVGCIDLATGGYAKWLEAPANTGFVRSIVQWYGRTVFTVDGYGAVMETVASGANDNSVATGELVTSIADLNTGLRKGFGPVSATFDPLPSGATITVAYSLDAGTSYTTLSPSVTAAGQKSAEWDLSVESDSIMLKVTLTHASTTTPVLRSLLCRAHPLGIADQVLIMPVNCADTISGLNGRPLPENGFGAGSRRTRLLESFAQTRVKVQDVDYQDTGASYIYDLVAVDSRRVGVQSQHNGKSSNSYVTTLTMRRRLK